MDFWIAIGLALVVVFFIHKFITRNKHGEVREVIVAKEVGPRPLISGWAIFFVVMFVLPALPQPQEIVPVRGNTRIYFEDAQEQARFFQHIGTLNNDELFPFHSRISVMSYPLGWSQVELGAWVNHGATPEGVAFVDIEPWTSHSGLIMGVRWAEEVSAVMWHDERLTLATSGQAVFTVFPFISWQSRLDLPMGSQFAHGWLTFVGGAVQVVNVGSLIGIPVYFLGFRKRD